MKATRGAAFRRIATLGVLGCLLLAGGGASCGGGGGGRGFPLSSAAVMASNPDPYFSMQLGLYPAADGALVSGDAIVANDDDDFALWDTVAGTFLADSNVILLEAIAAGALPASPQQFDVRTFQAYYETPCSGGSGTFVWHGVLDALSSSGGTWDFAYFDSVDVTFSNCLFTGPADSLGQTGGASPLIILNGRLLAAEQFIDNFPTDVIYKDTLTGSLTATSGTGTWFASSKSIVASAASCFSMATGCPSGMSSTIDGGMCVGGNVVRNNNETDADDGCAASADPGVFMPATMAYFSIFSFLFP